MPEIPDVLTVLHPVPVRYLPRRGRLERMGLAQAATPVRLTRAEYGDLGTVMPTRSEAGTPILLSRIDGRVFVNASAADGPGGRAPDFAAFLLRDAFAPRETIMDQAFGGTPVSARLNGFDGAGRATPLASADCRGFADALAGAGEVIHDGTDAARAALQEFFDGSVRIVGRRVYVDTGGVLFCQVRGRYGLAPRSLPFPRLGRTPGETAVGPLTRAEAVERRFDDLAEYHRFQGGDPPDLAEVEGDFRPTGLGEGVATDTGVLFANKAPGILLDVMAPDARAGTRGDMAHPEARAGIERLRWLSLLGSVGAVGPEGAHAALEHTAEVALWALSMPRLMRDEGARREIAELRKHCLEWALPRLGRGTARIVPADAEALAGLVP